MTKRRIGRIQQMAGGRYRAIIERGQKADGTRRVLSKMFDTREEADGWLLAKAVELGGREDLGAGVTLARVWESYKAHATITHKALYDYGWLMDTVWLPRFGDCDITRIRARDVQSTLLTQTSSVAHHAKTALSSVLTYAHRAGLLDVHPLTGHRFRYPQKTVSVDDDEDPFAAIDGTRDVWSVETAMRCFDLIQGLPLEPAWLACVGAGLRVEEALALRRKDVRRIVVQGVEVTQIAVHAARTAQDGRKATKTAQSVRVVAMLEPFGARLWELVARIGDKDARICPVSAGNQNKRWRGYFAEPSTSKHAPHKEGCNNLGRLRELPYLPLSKMRNTHVTIMAESGIPDAINARLHGHTQMVERRHYLSPDLTRAVLGVSERFA